MLNLSDKELDRLAREAADEYEPGNQASPGAWDRMQLRLDNEMGHFRPNLFRSIRRIPFYYAPLALLLVSVSYYLLKPSSRTQPHAAPSAAQPAPTITMTENSGSPPAAGTGAVRPLQDTSDRSIKNQNNTYRSTSTPYKENSNGNKASTSSSAPVSGSAAAPASATTIVNAASNGTATAGTGLTAAGTHTHNHPGKISSSEHNSTPGQTISSEEQHASAEHAGSFTTGANNHPTRSAGSAQQEKINHNIISSRGALHSADGKVLHPADGDPPHPADAAAPDLRLSLIDIPRSIRWPEPVIDDAGLRKSGNKTTTAVANTAATPINPGKKPSPSMHIGRPLQLGFSLSPDFSSVNTLAADKPGSNIGVTVDYQLINRLYIHTGFSLSHKDYTAAQDDYHVPYNYYRMNNMHDVSFVKGSLNLFEIPLALRYDFSVAGNTVFFVSGGLSSYLLTHENCNYYFDLFGRTARQQFSYAAHNFNLFSTVDLSMGVETGLSNSLSFLIAPYMKLPTTGLGFGRVEMSSVGVEFALKYSPVLKRKRH